MKKIMNANADELNISHKGNQPSCITHKTTQTQTPNQEKIFSRIREARTIVRGNKFCFSITDGFLYIYRPSNRIRTHTISIEGLLAILDDIHEKHDKNSFILDNKADPENAPERGFGGLICRVLMRKRAYAPVASYLGSIFCSAGILEHFKVKNMPNNPTNFRLILRPDSPANLLALIDCIPD